MVRAVSKCPVWMTQKPRKGDFGELKAKTFPRGSCPQTVPRRWKSGSIYSRSAPTLQASRLTGYTKMWLDSCQVLSPMQSFVSHHAEITHGFCQGPIAGGWNRQQATPPWPSIHHFSFSRPRKQTFTVFVFPVRIHKQNSHFFQDEAADFWKNPKNPATLSPGVWGFSGFSTTHVWKGPGDEVELTVGTPVWRNGGFHRI